MNTASSPIDQMLEQVAGLLADGQLDAAEQLLPAIMADGDETQRQMATIYREQLALLRTEADEAMQDPVAAALENTAETAVSQHTGTAIVSTSPDTATHRDSSMTQGQITDLALEQVAGLLADGQLDAVEELLPGIIADGDETQRQMAMVYREQLELLRTATDAISTTDNDTTVAKTHDRAGIDQALEQVATLLADGQLDTVEELLPGIIADGDETQRQMAMVYREQLELLRSAADAISATDNNTGTATVARIHDRASIDRALEQVSTLLADNQLEAAAALLPNIITNGTEIQRQTGILYREQLVLLYSAANKTGLDGNSQTDTDENTAIIDADDNAIIADDNVTAVVIDDDIAIADNEPCITEESPVTDIDHTLEQVAALFADGQLDDAEALLPLIIDEGDEVQRQMGMIYRDQLMLLRSEADSNHAVTTESVTTANKQQDIDHALEQIAALFADGQLDDAEALLPRIIDEGDEVQRQVGMVYREQLALLRSEEQNNAPLATDELVLGNDGLKIPAQDNSAPSIPYNQPALPDENAKTGNSTLSSSGICADLLAQFKTALVEADNIPRGPSGASDHAEQQLEQAVGLLNAQQFGQALAALREALHNGNTAQQYLARHYLRQSITYLTRIETRGAVPEKPEFSFKTSKQEKQDNTGTAHPATTEQSMTGKAGGTLAEMVLARAIALIGIDNDKAVRLLHSVAEAGTPEQQAQALVRLAEIENGSATIADTTEHTDTGTETGNTANMSQDKVIPATLAENTLPVTHSSGEDVANTQQADHDSAAIIAQTDIAPVVHSGNDGSNEEWIPPLLPALSGADTDDNTTVEDEILCANTNGLRLPHEVLQPNYGLDTLPAWIEGADILQHELDAHQRQGFYIGNLAMMIDFASGSELTEIPVTYRVPNAPRWLIGLTNIHSIIIPVFDLVSFFGLPPAPDDKKMLLIIGHGDASIGIVIAGLPRRLHWQADQVVDSNTAPVKLRRCIRSACLLNGQLWFDLDCEALSAELKAAMQPG